MYFRYKSCLPFESAAIPKLHQSFPSVFTPEIPEIFETCTLSSAEASLIIKIKQAKLEVREILWVEPGARKFKMHRDAGKREGKNPHAPKFSISPFSISTEVVCRGERNVCSGRIMVSLSFLKTIINNNYNWGPKKAFLGHTHMHVLNYGHSGQQRCWCPNKRCRVLFRFSSTIPTLVLCKVAEQLQVTIMTSVF